MLAARAQGAKHRRIMIREVLPNVLPAMFSIALLGIAVAIVAEGTLAILGAGVETDTPTWGNMIAHRPQPPPARAAHRVRARAHDLLHRARAQLARRRRARPLRRAGGWRCERRAGTPTSTARVRARPLLEVDRRRDALRDRPRARARGRRRVVHARPRPHARHRRRVGLGQDGAVALDHGPAPEAAASSATARSGSRATEIGHLEPEGDAQVLGRADGDGVPGPDDRRSTR